MILIIDLQILINIHILIIRNLTFCANLFNKIQLETELIKMQQHPIHKFLSKTFSQKQVEKINQWAQCLIKQQYETVDDLREISDQVWVILRKQIPLAISQGIKKKLKQTSLQNKIENNQDKIIQNQIQEVLSPKKDNQLVIKPKDKTIQEKKQVIIEPKDKLTQEKIKEIKQSRPYPTNCKQISIKNNSQLAIFHSKDIQDPSKRYYTFLMVGQKGSGKTSLINFLVNKLKGISRMDNWRWIITDQQTHADDLKTSTQQIKQYIINGSQQKFCIRIIEIPGLKYELGLKRNDQLVKKIQNLISKRHEIKIHEIDYILLTFNSKAQLLTQTKYVYERIQQIFGIDTKDRFILMCTFADNNKNYSLQDLKRCIFYDRHFLFNNSILYDSFNSADKMHAYIWDLSQKSVDQFKDYIKKRNQHPLSLDLSKKVVSLKRQIFNQVSSCQDGLLSLSQDLIKAEQTYNNISQNKKNIHRNKNFEKDQIRFKFLKTRLQKPRIICENCQIDCCKEFNCPTNSVQTNCTHFSIQNMCSICPGNCSRSSHLKIQYSIIKSQHRQTVIIDFIKTTYQQQIRKKDKLSKDMQTILQKIDNLIIKILLQAIKIKVNINNLKKIALNQQMFSHIKINNQIITQSDENTQQIALHQKYIKMSVIYNNIDKNLDIHNFLPEIIQFKKKLQTFQKQIQYKCTKNYQNKLKEQPFYQSMINQQKERSSVRMVRQKY